MPDFKIILSVLGALGVLGGFGGTFWWLVQRRVTRPRPRVVVRHVALGTDPPSRITFEVANGGERGIALYPVVRASGYKLKLTRRRWYPGWLVSEKTAVARGWTVPLEWPGEAFKLAFDVEEGDLSILRYETNGGAAIHRDKVSVEVLSVSELFDPGEGLTISCANGRGEPVAFSALPRAAVLLIQNHSEHIISLGQTAQLTGTVIILEDDLAHQFRLFTEESWKEDLAARIEEFYDRSRDSAVSAYNSSEPETNQGVRRAAAGAILRKLSSLRSELPHELRPPVAESILVARFCSGSVRQQRRNHVQDYLSVS